MLLALCDGTWMGKTVNGPGTGERASVATADGRLGAIDVRGAGGDGGPDGLMMPDRKGAVPRGAVLQF
jgi:hypothetical protein